MGSVHLSTLLADFNEADPTETSGNSPKIKVDGVHRVRILEIICKPSKIRKDTYFIVEFEVLNTDMPDDVGAGKQYGWAHNLNNKWYGAANVKNFIAAAVGLDPASDQAKKLTLENVYEVLGMVTRNAEGKVTGVDPSADPAPAEKQPLTGKTIWLNTLPQTREGVKNDEGKEESRSFVIHKWMPDNDQGHTKPTF